MVFIWFLVLQMQPAFSEARVDSTICEKRWDCKACADKYMMACGAPTIDQNQVYEALNECIRQAKLSPDVYGKCEPKALFAVGSRSTPARSTSDDTRATIPRTLESACMALYTLAKRDETQLESYAKACKVTIAACLPKPRSFAGVTQWITKKETTAGWEGACDTHAKAFKTKPQQFWKADQFYGQKIHSCKSDLGIEISRYIQSNDFTPEDFASFSECASRDGSGAVIYTPEFDSSSGAGSRGN